MTIETALATLNAALELDEQTARAAICGTSTHWVADGDEVWATAGPLTGPHRCDQHEAGIPNDCDDDPVATASDIRDINAPARATHIARFGPRHQLKAVEAIRRVLAEYVDLAAIDAEDDEPSDNGFDIRVGAYADVIEVLAGIYTEPEEPTDG